jgi:DNA-directed RNA polymerase subunit omega
MLKLSVNDIVKHNENCYSFVIALAKRARQISESAIESGELLDEKPVQMAVAEFVAGKFRIVEQDPKSYTGGN